MYQYLRLIPFGLIYILLFFIFIPRISGKGAKFFTIILLIPISYFLAGFADHYLPRLLYNFSRFFKF